MNHDDEIGYHAGRLASLTSIFRIKAEESARLDANGVDSDLLLQRKAAYVALLKSHADQMEADLKKMI